MVMAMGRCVFSEKNRLTECFYENIVPFGLLARKVINML